MSGLLFGETEGGQIKPFRVDEDGKIVTAAGGGGASGEVTGEGGEPLATEATAAETATAAQALAGTVNTEGTAIQVVDLNAGPTFAAAPPVGTEVGAVYLAGAGPLVPDRDNIPRYSFVEANSSVIESNTGFTASQVEEINAKTPELEGGRVPVETELAAAGPLATQEAVEEVQRRQFAIATTPITFGFTATDAPVELSAADAQATASSPYGWKLRNNGSQPVYLSQSGDPVAEGYPIAKDEEFVIPSASLAGWFVACDVGQVADVRAIAVQEAP